MFVCLLLLFVSCSLLLILGFISYLVAMSITSATVWDYSSLEMIREIVAPCSFALGGGEDDDRDVRLVGGDKSTGTWNVWDVLSGEKLFSCKAEEGSFSGGWFIVHRSYLIVYRRSHQLLRGYRWNYNASRGSDITPPMFSWELLGNFSLPKSTRFGLLMTDVLRGLVRIDMETGATALLLPERSEDLDPRNPRVRLIIDKGGMTVTRRSTVKNAPVQV